MNNDEEYCERIQKIYTEFLRESGIKLENNSKKIYDIYENLIKSNPDLLLYIHNEMCRILNVIEYTESKINSLMKAFISFIEMYKLQHGTDNDEKIGKSH